MTILAIDSSGTVASVALLVDDRLVAEYSVNYKKTHSQTLLPMLEEIMTMTETPKSSVDAIAIASGPGSFTGLRIGSATAKGLGLAWEIPLIAVPTLDGMAYQYESSARLICPMMDARRNQVYTGLYTFAPEFTVCEPQMAVPVTDLLERVNALGREVIFLGDGAVRYKEMIEQMTTVPFRFAPAHRNQQSAAALAVHARQLYDAGQTVSADAFVPEYLRKSQAEREREERLAQTAEK